MNYMPVHLMGVLMKIINDMVPNNDYSNKKVMVVSRAQEVPMFLDLLIKYGANDIVVAMYGHKAIMKLIRKMAKERYKGINIKIITTDKLLKMITGEEMRFDFIVGNPPYNGLKQLHQQIFNKCVNLLKANGELSFIQPATAYQSNEEFLNKRHTQKMIEIIKFYKTSVKIVGGGVFKDNLIATELSITNLKKIESTENIEQVEYSNGKIYKDVDIKDICVNNTPPGIFHSIHNKYKKLINKNGSLLDIAKEEPKENTIAIAKIRGHICTTTAAYKSDFFTFYSGPNKETTKNIKYGLLCKKGQESNMYAYLDSKFARYGLSMLKLNTNIISGGKIALTPIVDFSKSWTDQELYDMAEFTAEEIKEIEKVIPIYERK